MTLSDTPPAAPPARSATRERTTRETAVRVRVDLDAPPEGSAPVARTGLGFLDHMLDALSRHSAIALSVRCEGDLAVDDHHSVEDCALVLGAALDEALGDRSGIERFASAHAPLDEALARCVIDLSGRPGAWVELGFVREMIGGVATENITHFFESLAITLRATIHIDLIRGTNDHHKAEAAFKALALALRDATRVTRPGGVPSTKGTLS